MDALSALWLTSVVGAAGFTAAGFFLARSGILGAGAASASPAIASATPHAAAGASAGAGASSVIELPAPPASVAAIATNAAPPASPPASPEPDAASASAPPPPESANVHLPIAPPRRDPRRDPRREESEAFLPAAPPSEPEPVAGLDLESQLSAVRFELRSAVLDRDKAERHGKELASRLSAMTDQVAALRARVSEEAQVARALRDTMQAAQAQTRTSSLIPSATSDAARARLSSRAPGLFAEIEELKTAVAHLTAENATLRAAALDAPAVKPRVAASRDDLVIPEVLERVVARIMRLDNVRSATVAESSGLVLAGVGELSDALAAFSAYIADAALRSERLLPLRAPQEITIRDTNGLVFSTKLLGRHGELALVMLASGEVSTRQVREI